MNSRPKIGLNWLKTCTPAVFAIATIIGTELAANAIPVHIPLPASNPHSIRRANNTISSPTPPASLNVTPNPFRQTSSSYYSNYDSYYWSDCPQNKGKFVRVESGRIRNSTLINPTIINSDISDSVIIDPTIIKPRITNYTVPTTNSSYVRIRFQ
jgi:hypothetical protein